MDGYSDANSDTGPGIEPGVLRSFAPHPYQSLNPAGEIIAVNDAWLETLGYDREEVLGERFDDFVSPAGSLRFESVFEDFGAEGRITDVRFDLVHADGHPVPVALDGQVEGDGDGSMRRTHCQFREVSDRARRVRELERFETIVENTDDVVFEIDGEGAVSYVNPRIRAVLGRSPAALEGEQAAALAAGLIAEDRADELRETIESILEGTETGAQFEFTADTEGMGQVTLSVRLSRVEHDAGEAGIVGVARNVSALKERERDLARSTAVLSTVLDTMPVGVMAEDEHREIMAANDAFCELFDLDAACEELLGRRGPDAAAAVKDQFADPDGVIARIEDLIDSREAVLGEEVEMADGRTLSRTYVPYSFAGGDGELWLYRDITERKSRQRELAKYQAFVEYSSDVITIVDENGVVEYVSPASRDVSGHEPATLEGTVSFEYVHPDDRAALADSFADVISGETDRLSAEYRFEHADGSWIWVESTAIDRRQVDEIGGIVVVSRDVTDRKEREWDMRRLTREYETIVQEAEDAVFLIDVQTDGEDPEFRIERLNPAHEAMTGLQSEEVRGKQLEAALGDELGGEVGENYRRCYEAGEPISFEEELELPAGTRIWQTKLAPVEVEGAITQIVGISRDITERKAYERELQRKNERLDEFAGVVSHDLRNPISVAQGRAALLDEAVDSDHLPPLRDALERMERIIEDTLTLARQGESVGETEPIQIQDLVGQCWGMVDTESATIDVGEPFEIRGDRDRLQHVFENLFRNAVEHGGEDVAVCVGRAGPNSLFVADDGPGIPDGETDRIFDAGHSVAPGNTGFGLTIVQRIAEAHGWSVEVAESEDGGARFEFTGVEIE